MPLVYLPNCSAFFLWDDEVTARLLPDLLTHASPGEATLVLPSGVGSVEGLGLPLLDSVGRLALVSASELPALPAAVQVWALAGKHALELVSRERVLPSLVARSGQLEARWAAALTSPEDASRVAMLARAMPPAAHAVPPAPGKRSRNVWAPEALLRAFLDATVDAMVRMSRGAPAPLQARSRSNGDAAHVPWEQRLARALSGASPSFEPRGFGERTVADDVNRWSEPVLGRADRLRACFRLELPAESEELFTLSLFLQSPEDPSLLVSAADVWKTAGRRLERLGRAFRDPQESLLEALGRAARVCPALEDCLQQSHPEGIALDPTEAWTFLSEGAPALIDAGFSVILPSELTTRGQRRLRLRMRIGTQSKTAGMVKGAAGLSLDSVLQFAWEAALGDDPLTARELALLAKHKAPLIRHRGAWVAVDPRELADIHRRIGERHGPARRPRSAPGGTGRRNPGS